MLGPLAKALSLLSSDAGQILVQIEEATRTAGVDFERQIKAANESLETTITATGQATVELNRAAGNLSWVRYGLTMMSGLGAAALRVLGLAQHAERAADRGLSSGGRGARADADRGDQDRQRTGQAGKVQAAAASFALAAELACLECEREERVRRLLVQAEQRQARREQALRRLVQARPEVPQGPWWPSSSAKGTSRRWWPGRLLTVSAKQQAARCRAFPFANAHAVPQQSVGTGQLHSSGRPSGSVARTDLLIQESDLLLCSQL